MSIRYHTLFKQLAAANEGAFVPFVVLGDPDLESSLHIIQTLIDAGADALELGIPFSNPVADGPVIQAAHTRALNAGITFDDSLVIIDQIRRDNPTIPIGLLLYTNQVIAYGLDAFYEQAAAVGVDSVLVADLSLQEFTPFAAIARKYGVQSVLILPPNAEPQLCAEISARSEGYLYLVSRPGVTGIDTAVNLPQRNLLKQLNNHTAPPVLLGFGIATPSHVQSALASGVAGVICGSAIVNLVARLPCDVDAVKKISDFVSSMKAATKQ